MTEDKEKKDKLKVITQSEVQEAMENNPDKKWFILQTYSGKEQAAMKSIQERLITGDCESDVGIIVMAEKLVNELRSGQMKTIKRKLYPSYLWVLAKVSDEYPSIMDEKTYHAIIGASNLIGFIGKEKTSLPKAIESKLEIRKMTSQLQESDEVENSVKFETGTPVKVKTGPFDGLRGIIDEVYDAKGRLKVNIVILGVETPIELSFADVELTTE